MFRKNKQPTRGARVDDDEDATYALNWPSSDRWNPNYSVPRNSVETTHTIDINGSDLEKGTAPIQRVKHSATSRSMSWGLKRDLDTAVGGRFHLEEEDEEEFSNLTHWLETLAELYMNELDNRARWDPRWLNVTRRERFEGLSSVEVTILDYLKDDSVKTTETTKSKIDLATALQDRSEDSQVRVILVNDLSRFIMGALGQMYSIDPEFWFEHLISSGYGASDSGLKLKNAVWMNWAERETRFRHHALPKIGQRTEWNVPRRTKTRDWAHLRWGRLGLLNYLGRKGFHEDEMEKRISDGRWMIERDVRLDKRGLFLTAKRQAQAEKKARKKAGGQRDTKPPSPQSQSAADGSTGRSKASNVYRPFSSFVPLPRNPGYWKNRDLRVLAPEGVSYWSTEDDDGRKTIIVVFDPIRNMRHEETREMTPSLTFMPRAMEFESYSDEELWRTAQPGETYLDPPPPPIPSKRELKRQKRAARRQMFKEREQKLKDKLTTNDEEDWDSVSAYTSDSEYDEEYENTLRKGYSDPTQYSRDRDYARKYALSTSALVTRYLSKLRASEFTEDNSLISSILTRLYLDDFWQLLAELRLSLDQIDGDMGADLHLRLLDAIGLTIRQNAAWMRSTLQELRELSRHMQSLSGVLARPPELSAELEELSTELESLHARTEQTLNLLISSTGLSQSTLVIDQTSGINKLTELAFFFIPLSFITSIFSMQVYELTETPPRLWTWGLSLSIVFIVTYLIRSIVRSPSVRVFAMNCRVTMLNRFTSSGSRSSSRRLNAIGNRTIVKFLFFFVAVTTTLIGIVIVFLTALVLVFGGIWLGAIATAIYFIVTRWPELAVVIPCFISIALSALGMYGTWSYTSEIGDLMLGWCDKCLMGMKDLFPARWVLDSVDDDDLAKEGIETYSRQAIVLSST